MQDNIVRLGVAAAKKKNVRPSAMLALIEIETRGIPFEPDGVTPRFLFERHIFWRECASKGPAALARARAEGLAIPAWNRATQYRDQGTPAGRASLLARAIAVNEEAAYASASWGLPQVCGFNHRLVGYASAKDMVEAMRGNVEAQIEIFVRFLERSNIIDPLRRLDWHTVARLYNGASYAQNGYHRLLPAAFNKYAPIYGLLGLGDAQGRAEEILAREIDPTELQAASEKWESAYGFIAKRPTPAEQELPHDEVLFIQQRLRDLGYAEVGMPDGNWSTRTTAAISAFQAQELLKVTGSYDAETKARLETAQPRPPSFDRQMATADTLRDSRTIKSAARLSFWSKVWGGILAAFGLDQKTGDPVTDQIVSLQSKASYFKSVSDQVMAFVGDNKLLLAAVGCFVVYLIAKRIIAYRVEDHNTGVHAGTR